MRLALRPSALVSVVFLACTATAGAQIPARGSYAFTNVSVVPMDAERILENQTVVVESGHIAALGPATSTPVPDTATRIDGRGKFLLPGLTEMHGHIPRTLDAAEDVLLLYLAGGATTVRGMQGHPAQLDFRTRVQTGEMIGPRLVLAAPAMRGDNVPNTATAERLVRDAAARGYDLLKIHEGLTVDVYATIVRTATEVGLPWGGHVPDLVGVDGALAVGQSTIDHLDNYIDAMQPPDSPALAATGAQRQRLMALHADESRIPELARSTRDASVAVVPTQILWEVLRGHREPEPLSSRPENRYMPAATRALWLQRARSAYNRATREAAAREADLRQQLLKTMHDEGVLVLMGTDAPQIFSVPGYSLHRELPLMVEAGLTPYEVLRTGTVNIARFFGTDEQAGTVTVGKNADLLLLEANPLEDIDAVTQNAGVMVDGRWISGEFIAERLEAIAAKHAR